MNINNIYNNKILNLIKYLIKQNDFTYSQEILEIL